MDDREAERIREVYAAYDTDPRVQARRDPGNRANLLIAREREAALNGALAGPGPVRLGDADILDVGCGAGDELARLVERGANASRCHGIDLLPDRVARANRRLPGADMRVADARDLPFGPGRFDIVILNVVLSSVLDRGIATRIAGEVDRVLRPGGVVLWYDSRYPNPFNRHVRGISRRDLAGLFAGYEARLQAVTVVPPLARRLGGVTDRIYPALARLAPLCVRYAGILAKPYASQRTPST
jgi:SAM-dependent methyltransferase